MVDENEKKTQESCQCDCQANQVNDCACQGQTECEQSSGVAEPTIEDQLADALAKAAANYDLYMRAMAEVENTRRRAADDVQKAQRFSIEKFAQQLLPVVDSLEKALEVTVETEGAMREGLLATHRQMMHALEMSGMTPIDPMGEKFDPNTQQAISMVPATEGLSAGQVATVFQRGWKIHDRVLRPAMVSVVQG